MKSGTAYKATSQQDRDYNIALRKEVELRMENMRMYRWSWWYHWYDIAEFMLPRRYKWLITPNLLNRGSMINQKIIDSTVIKCIRDLTAGMMGAMLSPARVWFELSLVNKGVAARQDVKVWLAECRTRMLAVMAAGNFYPSMQTMLGDGAVFGTAPIIIYEDYDNVFHCYTPCAGEYFVSNNYKFTVDTLYREFTLSAKECVQQFSYACCSPQVCTLYDSNAIDTEVVICHAIEPNNAYEAPNAINPMGKGFLVREIYWEKSSGRDCILLEKGFKEDPFAVLRWDLVGNDPYGRGPGMDALGDVKQLYVEQMRKAQGIDKMVNPPLIAHTDLKNQPASLLPGGITYANMANGNIGMKPIYTVNPQLNDLKEDIIQVQQRIRDLFFNDLFLMISQLDSQAEPRTATEINERKQEKLLMLGPMVERLQSEVLNKIIGRIFRIMYRAQLLPPPPDGVRGQAIDVSYVNMFSQAQKAVGTTAIEQVVSFTGQMAQLKPAVLDNIDFDVTSRMYGEMLSAPPKMFTDLQAMAQERQQQAQAQQQQQVAEQAPQAAGALANLSKVDVGGGQNAAAMMLSGLGGGGGQ